VSNSTLSTTLQNAAPIIQVINVLSQGTSDTTRLGDKSRMKHVNMKINFGSTSSLTTASTVRVMLIREKTTLGSALSPSQYFDSATPAPATFQRNVTTRDPSRFITLYDSGTKVISPAQYLVAGPCVNMATPNLICLEQDMGLDFITDYSRANGGTVSDIDTNGLNLVIFTANTTANAIFAIASWTIDFTDN
jgi:hypothetical protein